MGKGHRVDNPGARAGASMHTGGRVSKLCPPVKKGRYQPGTGHAAPHLARPGESLSTPHMGVSLFVEGKLSMPSPSAGNAAADKDVRETVHNTLFGLWNSQLCKSVKFNKDGEGRVAGKNVGCPVISYTKHSC